MRHVMKLLQRGLERFGLYVSRTPGNRFDVVETALLAMRRLGFEPRVVIDGGANRGQFFSRARPVFPDSVFHLIEPQPRCVTELEVLASSDGGDVRVHCTALSEPGVGSVRMVGGGEGGGGAGNWVAKPSDDAPGEFVANATTLDELLGESISREDRALLKLDLERHEIVALSGASELLEKVEVILTEVSFYDADDWGGSLFADMVLFLRERGFMLYEMVSLSGRALDGRLRLGDAVFVRTDSTLCRDNSC